MHLEPDIHLHHHLPPGCGPGIFYTISTFQQSSNLKFPFLELNGGGKEQRTRSFNGGKEGAQYADTQNPQYNKSQGGKKATCTNMKM